MPVPRSRPRVATMLAVTIALGLHSRRPALHWPAFVTMYVGDVLWATMMFWLLAMLAPGARARTLAAAALAIACLVEVSQRYETPWLVAMRQHRLGRLVLGQGFLASDLLCYVAGVLLAVVVDRALFGGSRQRTGS